PRFPDENCPQGNCASLAQNPSPGVNDPDGSALAQVNDFVRFLGPPPRGAPGSGSAMFAAIGCSFCHVQTLVTAPNASGAFDRVAYHPFSDFLLHDMGSLGDGIDQGDAKGAEMRTQPLWGVSQQTRLLHDGRVRTIADAILAHDGQGKPARDRFAALSDSERRALLAFLDTL
ncbi:MAG: thiol oxidoreductase, partial [Deltaproteobacteria bacterium]